MDRREVSSSNFASLQTEQGQKVTYVQLFYCEDKKEDFTSECLWFPVADKFMSGQKQQ